ncbi:AraC family transcriptional regulator (plasmid) [Sphingobium xenophagum]|nr:AraC family transcriptional regulator [Sphingobium xenophagum]
MAMRCDVPVGALTDFEMLISWPCVCRLMETAATELQMPSFGLEMALTVPRYFPNVGPLVFMAEVVDTVGEWARTGVLYWRFHTNAYLAQLLEDGEDSDVIFRFRHSPFSPPARHQIELGLANLLRMAQIVPGFTDIYPTEVHFRHARPSDTRVHEEIFNCPLQFDAEYDEIVLPREYLSYPTKGRLTPLKSLLNFYVRYRIRKMPLYDQSFRATVEVAIPALIGSGSCNADFVAKTFGISGKKLQRLLAQEGTSFSEVFDGVRRTMACRFLDETEIPIRNIAGLLDYSGTPAFIMAFRRWTDSTPSEYRAQHI